LPVRREHDRSKRVVRFQACERIQPETNRLDLGSERKGQIVGRDRAQYARIDVRPHHGRDVRRMRLGPDSAEGLSRTTLHERRRVLQRRHEGRGSSLLTDEAERERRHLPHFGVRVGRHDARERNDALREPDPPHR
jgi:hypothetical protein